MNEGYGWRQLSQWDMIPRDAHAGYKKVKKGASLELYTYLLVNRTYRGKGVTSHPYVKKGDVTQEILDEAGEAGK